MVDPAVWVEGWAAFNPYQAQVLKEKLKELDFSLLAKERELIGKPVPKIASFSPCQTAAASGSLKRKLAGEALLKKGVLGALVVAGGQGSRLKVEGPKGCVVVTARSNKSLFQLLAEKTIAACEFAGKALPLAIMTSRENDAATQKFFQDHSLFGLSKEQLFFFCQEDFPLLSNEGLLFLQGETSLALAPNGNGEALKRFVESGIAKRWEALGIKHLHFLPVDNPLADPFDPELLGCQVEGEFDACIKCIERQDRDEKVGVIVEIAGKHGVVEYTELKGASCEQYPYANAGLFCFSLDFVRRAASQERELPLHAHQKEVNAWGGRRFAWKFEKFIFDNLRFAYKTGAIVYPRAKCFAPLKNYEGNDSLATVREALLRQGKD